MNSFHIVLGILIAAVWGFNYTAIHIALKDLSPLFLCSLRFILVSFPAIFFIKKPKVPLGKIVSYGLIMFALQFLLTFTGIHMGVSPGLASILLQSQAFFTVFFAVFVCKEKFHQWQLIGALISFAGIGLVGIHLEETVSLTGFLLVLCAAIGWGVGSILVKKMGPINQISLVVWASFVAWPPLLFSSLLVEGPHNLWLSITHVSSASVYAILYITFISTCFGFTSWNWLIAKYPISHVAPFTLLVPIFGIIGAAIGADEVLHYWKILAGILVLVGLGVHQFGARLFFSRPPKDLFRN